MGKKPEKICKKHTGPKERKHAKRQLRRLRRRLEKRDPEDAPEQNAKLTRGWTD